DGVPHGASGRILPPQTCQVVDELVEEVRPLRGGHPAGELLQLRDVLRRIDAVQLADQHVLVREELVQSADGHLRPTRHLVEGEGLEPDVDKHAPRGREDTVEALAAAGLRGTTTGDEEAVVRLCFHVAHQAAATSRRMRATWPEARTL